jgi:hypothetical protein
VAHADLATTDRALNRSRFDLLCRFPIRAIVNFEGKLPDSVSAWNASTLKPKLNKKLKKVVFLRGPLNNAASLCWRIKRYDYINLFRFFHQIHALEELLGAAAAGHTRSADHVVPLWRWQEDRAFRETLAVDLRLRSAALPDEVSRFGGGSSFGQDRFADDDRGQLYRRWRTAISSDLFLAPFTDESFCEMTRHYVAEIGRGGDISLADVDEVVRAARESPRAAHWKRYFLDGLRASRDWLVRLERSPSLPYREYVRARLRLGLALHGRRHTRLTRRASLPAHRL